VVGTRHAGSNCPRTHCQCKNNPDRAAGDANHVGASLFNRSDEGKEVRDVIAIVIVCIALGMVLLHAGQTETGWRFAPLRATGLVVGVVFRVAVFVATLVLAFVVAAVGGALRSNF
jgi:Na+/H+-dicarboxylate symporter